MPATDAGFGRIRERESMSIQLPLDFHSSVFCGEVRPELGEDNWCCGFCEDSGMIAVFDGCGGSGARKHSDYAGHSEAYMASRIAAGALYRCMQQHFPCRMDPEQFVNEIVTPALAGWIKANEPQADSHKPVVKGMRVLPTTMAAALIQPGRGKNLRISSIWAGDSRVYVLDANGLSQLTVDDSNQPDPMEGLYDDGTLTNLISADRDVNLNYRSIEIKPPFMVFAASDGCFGYVSTPMEFEGMILHTMLESANVAQWEDNLRKLTASFAGDDHTICLASFGFGSFENIQRTFTPRYKELRKKYLKTVWDAPWEDRDTRRRLWADYRINYMKYLESDKR